VCDLTPADPQAPITRIDLKVGFRCNNRCVFCVQGDKRARFEDKTTAALFTLLEEGRQTADEVVFTGGEVTLRKDLEQLVSHARDIGYRVIQLQTNGRILSKALVVERLVAAGVTEFGPSLHGHTPEIHDGLTHAKGAFRQTVHGIRNVKYFGLPVIVNSVITRANQHHLPQLAALLVALEVDQFQLAFVHALGSAAEHFDEVVPRLSDVAPGVARALRVGHRGRVRCATEGIPLCFLGDQVEHAAEWSIPRTRIYDANQVIADYTATRIAEGKAKGPPCATCALDSVCEGPWREYPERFGWDEFIPIPEAQGAPSSPLVG
jgi:MoaA/NifB/PqqE/SkfB family radical SAM enzyme